MFLLGDSCVGMPVHCGMYQPNIRTKNYQHEAPSSEHHFVPYQNSRRLNIHNQIHNPQYYIYSYMHR